VLAVSLVCEREEVLMDSSSPSDDEDDDDPRILDAVATLAAKPTKTIRMRKALTAEDFIFVCDDVIVEWYVGEYLKLLYKIIMISRAMIKTTRTKACIGLSA
jgi:hypothetical protein